MKKIASLLIALCIGTLSFAQDFDVNQFSADIYLSNEGYYDVVEKYDVYFHMQKHGLYRKIQTKYDFQDATGKISDRSIKIDHIDVPGHPFKTSSLKFQRLAGNVEIYIGDPNQYVTEAQHYEIRYRVSNALIDEDSIVHLYWNIKAAEWQAPFHQITFRVHAPEGSVLSAQNCFTYAGVAGNTDVSKDFSYQYNDSIYTAVSKPGWVSKEGEYVTTLVKLPRTLFIRTSPPFFSKEDYTWMGILLGIIGLFGMTWSKYGKDEKVIGLTSYYPPENIDPAMAGFLMNDREDASDLIALLPKWGAEGKIKLQEIPKEGWFGRADTKLIKYRDLSENAPEYEKILFEGLFSSSKATTDENGKSEVLISDLRDSFYVKMHRAKEKLKKEALPFYEAQSERIKNMVAVIAVLLLLATTITFFIFFGIMAGIAAFIVCLVIAIMSMYLRKKNAKGNQVLAELKGFRQFVKLADTNRIQTLLKDDPNYFEKTMSYALAFGLLDEWAGKFNDLNIPPPSWYQGSQPGQRLSMNSFAQSFGSSMSKAQTAMVSTPSSSGSGSSGGGSSGGGFGGGGGGSW